MHRTWMTDDEAYCLLECSTEELEALIADGRLSPSSREAISVWERRPGVTRYFRWADVEAQSRWIRKVDAARQLGCAFNTLTYRVRFDRMQVRYFANRTYLLRQEVARSNDLRIGRRREPFACAATCCEIAYAAGLFDGEGHVVLQGRTAPSRFYMRAIRITNTSRAVLEWLQRRFGGRIRDHGWKNRPAQWRPIWDWRLDGFHAAALLRLMLPHLQIKREQAALLIEFDDHIVAAGASSHRPLTPDEIEWRADAILRMKRLRQPTDP